MVDILKTIPANIKRNIITERFKKGDLILVQGDINEYLYFIDSGKVEVRTMSRQGLDIAITTFRAGESIGVLEIFNSDIHTQTVIVKEPCTTRKLHKKHVLEWMREDFKFTLYVIKLLEQCFYDTSLFARNIISMTIKERIILSIYKHFSNNTLHTLTKHELTQETGTQIRSSNRAIEELTRMGILKYENKKFIVLDEQLLSKKAKALM